MGRTSQQRMTGRTYEQRKAHPRHHKQSTGADNSFSPMSLIRALTQTPWTRKIAETPMLFSTGSKEAA